MLDPKKLRHRRNPPGTGGGAGAAGAAGGDTVLPLHKPPPDSSSSIQLSLSTSPTVTAKSIAESATTAASNFIFPIFKKRVKKRKNFGGIGMSTTTTNVTTSTSSSSLNVMSGAAPSVDKYNKAIKRKRKRDTIRKFMKTCLSGVGATLVWGSLSVLLLPTAWFQVDYHHQVQHAATEIYQQVHRRGRIRGTNSNSNKMKQALHNNNNNNNHNNNNNNFIPGANTKLDDSRLAHQLNYDALNHKVGPQDRQYGQNYNPDQQRQNHHRHEKPGRRNHNRPRIQQEEDDNMEPIICPDGTTGFINDNYCDCIDDGSDETLTGACSHILVGQAKFICDDGETHIFTSRIKDGITDCHDGTDEL